MTQSTISAALRQAVADHFRHHCCYCLSSELVVGAEFTIDHIIPQALGGTSDEHNLCLACWRCNLLKREQVAAIDPSTGVAVRLFNPREQEWFDHFEWSEGGTIIRGLTPSGRATIVALQLNRAALVSARWLWIKAGWHPPYDL